MCILFVIRIRSISRGMFDGVEGKGGVRLTSLQAGIDGCMGGMR